MKYLLSAIILLLVPLAGNSQLLPDVTKYDVSITSIDYSGKTIAGFTRIEFTSPSQPISTLQLSLLSMNIDSIVHVTGTLLPYVYNDTNLSITLPAPVNLLDTDYVSVYYHGAPQTDPSNWGGFYFSGVYAFNLGVGFDSDPHCFGRAWFPCNDIFTDRSNYSFHITTPSNYKAFCNGILNGVDSISAGTVRWNWEFQQEIPTYLASMAVAPYTTWQRNYQSIPVEIAAMPNDTTNVTSTFIHLDSTLYYYIQAYGPYRYDKVGYCLIPFSSGAMEHASSIHIGRAFVNGLLGYETLWMHELSHMWWGDWVTCETEGDMWLNEGFASFNESYMTEKFYGTPSYRNWHRNNLRPVLQFAHITDGGYLPLINIPHAHTYGPTVYNKGAAIVHTLRNYMGDSLFFNGCKDYMNTYGNQNANSYNLRDELATSSGMDLTRFFDDWVFTPGFPHFSIDSVVYVPGGLDHYFVYTRQKSKGNNHIYEMPVQITLFDQYNDTTFTVVIDSVTNVFHFALPFTVQHFIIDKNDLMADAVTADEHLISSAGITVFTETAITINTQSTGNDTSEVRIEHHWVAADPFKSVNPGIRVSDYHYWRVDGLFNTGFHAKATFPYNGSTNLTSGWMDNTLITGTEDSLVLLHRVDASDDWHVITALIKNAGNKFDKIGNFVVDTLKAGEYTFGFIDHTTGLNSQDPSAPEIKIWPNPSLEGINYCLHANNNPAGFTVNIFDIEGKYLYSKRIQPGITENWCPRNNQKGTFLIKIMSGEKEIKAEKFQLL